MPRRRRQQQGLERVLGAPALFATAYGNVGSSIYYALGLVASYALGLTPLVFLITGLFFFATAARRTLAARQRNAEALEELLHVGVDTAASSGVVAPAALERADVDH